MGLCGAGGRVRPWRVLEAEGSLKEAMSGEDHQEQPMAEDGSNGGSSSPSPGDTLPWNLGKTQRSRRRGGGSGGNGSVLDPAERAVIRIAGNAVGLVCSACRRWLVDRAPAVCRCMTGRRGLLLSQVTADSTAPPAGPTQSAAGGLRLNLLRWRHHWSGRKGPVLKFHATSWAPGAELPPRPLVCAATIEGSGSR